MVEPTQKLNMLIEKMPNGKHALYACRGEGMGCKRNETRTTKKHCDSCMLITDPDMTIEQIVAKLKEVN